MKKFIKNKKSAVGFSLVGFVLFFLTIILTSTLSIFVYHFSSKASGGNIWVVGFSVLGMIIVGAVICTLCDILRRKVMIEKPLNQILEATHKIAKGNFDIRLEHTKDYSKFNEYDLIFDNINTMSEELSKNELLKNDFISNVSHEIKTPLSVIQNYAKALQGEKLTQSQKDEYLNGLIQQTKRLSNLVTNILKLNKLENKTTLAENKKFDLAELARQTALQYEQLIEDKGLELVCEIEDVEIIGDESLVEIVISNLLSNAIKFTDKGKIALEVAEKRGYAEIKISDTGCGISPEIGAQIFDKFYQGDTSHASEGNGLGLALVKRVIDIIGGEISVESNLKKGSTFTIRLKNIKNPYHYIPTSRQPTKRN